MKGFIERTYRGGRCLVYGENGPLMIQPVDAREAESLGQEVDIIKELTRAPFTLAALTVDDWNSQLTPWPAPPAFGDRDFGGGGAETLELIRRWLIPALDPAGERPVYLGGYSLAGMFALWSACETDAFSGIAAVSPSVWFPGWAEYMESHPVRAGEVYLSLGDREERTRNAVMAPVGRNIRRQYELLAGSPSVTRRVLRWNPGGHFAEPQRRTANGFAWLLEAEGT